MDTKCYLEAQATKAKKTLLSFSLPCNFRTHAGDHIIFLARAFTLFPNNGLNNYLNAVACYIYIYIKKNSKCLQTRDETQKEKHALRCDYKEN